MCFHYSMSQGAKNLENRYNAPFPHADDWTPTHHVNGFSFPQMPVVTAPPGKGIALMNWGLIPSWVRDEEQAVNMRSLTLNARSESAFEKPSFRKPILSGRCLVPADGFFEWQTAGNSKIPWYITLTEEGIFSFGGIWDVWTLPGKDPLFTYSILTTDANPMMAEIHNSKKRMPLILSLEQEARWLNPSLPREEIAAMMTPFPESQMKAWTISRLITSRGADTNTPEIKKHFPGFHIPDKT
ncbi:MAG TPA: SOS response-associated peptidase [Prolixibacteraceae bacterium]|nr:SOS response-associated peptidase [Prolixibacteraceae bacterium]